MAAQPFDWTGYFTLADELSRRRDEASLRTAISRAYYYVYQLALERAQANGFNPRSDEGVHKQLWRNFSASPDPDCRKLGDLASRLMEKRVRADYRPTCPRINDDISVLVADAQSFAVRLRALNARFPDPRMSDGDDCPLRTPWRGRAG
jgi:uncharacterized protein (UPF0332 family)